MTPVAMTEQQLAAAQSAQQDVSLLLPIHQAAEHRPSRACVFARRVDGPVMLSYLDKGRNQFITRNAS